MKSKRGIDRSEADHADAAALQRLKSAASDEQTAIALGLLKTTTRRDTLRLTLQWMRENPLYDVRAALLSLYDFYARDKGAHDYGTYVRSDIVRALHPIARREEGGLFVRALLTYEFPPPAFVEEAGQLRSAALVALAELDLDGARYHAARLIVDPYSDPMSGEPAVSAATTLAALDEGALLYSYICDPRNANRSEVVAECLRGLVRCDPALLPDLIRRIGEPPQPVMLLGMIDLLLKHEAGVQQGKWLFGMVNDAPEEHLKYLILTAITVGDDRFLTQLVETLRDDLNARRRPAARDALAPAAHRGDVKRVLAEWDRSRL